MAGATPGQRSVKIPSDERGGWSSDRPRRDGPPRPANIAVRGRVLRPSDRLRYSPGSMVLLVSASTDEAERFALRVLEDRGALLSMGKVRELLAGRVAEEDLEARAGEVLEAAVGKRLSAGDSVVVVARNGLDPEERERYARAASALRRPRHLVLLETARDQVAEDDLAPLNDLRRRLDAAELGEEGFQTSLRLGGGAVGEVKRIVFRPPPADD